MKPRLLSFAILVILLAATPVALAQSTSATAEQLFREAKALMKEKQYAEACSAFEASYKLDPTINTLANLADCREKNQQLATAMGRFLELEQQTRGDKNQKVLNKLGKDRADGLDDRLSYLIINVPDESRVNGLEITLNGTLQDPLFWNRKLPVDGGSYEVTGKAPAHEPWSTTVSIASEKETKSVDVPKFKTLPEPDPEDDKDPEEVKVVDPDRDVTKEGPPPSGMSGKRKAALGIGGLGVVGLGLGLVFELGARSAYDDSVAATDPQVRADKFDEAGSKRNLAIGSAVVGAACVGVATYLWLTGGPAKPRESASVQLVPTVGPTTVGVSFTGGF